MLIDIGFEYKKRNEYFDKRFTKNFVECKAFFEVHGHFPTKKENKRLRDWANSIYRKNTDNNIDKIKLSKNIGFEYKGEK